MGELFESQFLGFEESGFLGFLAEVLEAEFGDLAALGGFDH